MMKKRKFSIVSVSLFVCLIFGARGEVELIKGSDSVSVKIDGKLFARYNYGDAEFPYIYPLRTPNGVNVTRRWPMENTGDGEAHDHKHHKSLWFSHGDVNGLDFWTHGKPPNIIQKKIVSLKSGEEAGVLETENDWVDGEGNVVCTDSRRYVFSGNKDYNVIDIQIELKASNGQVVLGGTKEGAMALRVAPSMRLKGKVAKGHILMSTGVKDQNAWGKRAEWCDYFGPVDGETVGVAIFDAPDNLRHPTWWHARDYGLCAANPFGVSYFEKKTNGSGNFKLDNGDTLKFIYRIFVHRNQLSIEELQGKYEEWKLTVKVE